MGRKADLLNRYRKEVKAGSFVGTFNEFSGGQFSERGGATAARLERKAISAAGADMAAQIRAVGGNPAGMSLEEMSILGANARFGAFSRAQETTTVTTGESLDDVAGRTGLTTNELLLQNPSTFGMTSPDSITGVDTSVFAGQTLNISGLPPVQGPPPPDRGGGRGTAVPIAADFAARTQAQAQPQTTTGPIPGLPFAPGLPTTEVQALASSGIRNAVSSGRISNEQLMSMGESNISATGTIEEIISRAPADVDKNQMVNRLVDAFGSRSFMDTIGAFETNEWPTKIDEKSYRSLVEMMPPELAQELRSSYEQNFLIAGDRAYYPVLNFDPADTSGDSAGIGASSFVDTQGIKRGINRMLRRITPRPGGGGGLSSRLQGPGSSRPGSVSTSNGFTPTSRAIMWRV